MRCDDVMRRRGEGRVGGGGKGCIKMGIGRKSDRFRGCVVYMYVLCR